MSESMFARLWNTIVTLANDPDASVAKLGNILFMYIMKKVSHVFVNQPKLSFREGYRFLPSSSYLYLFLKEAIP